MVVEPLRLETTCITLAKGRYAVQRRELEQHRRGWQALSGRLGAQKGIRTDYCNGIATFTAGNGLVKKAGHWIEKLDASDGLQLDVGTFNSWISASASAGDFERAEEWFVRVTQPTLHPEFEGLNPDAASYDIMIRNCAGFCDVARAEKYVSASIEEGYRPALGSYVALVRLCVKLNEPRRGHRWLKELVEGGCSMRPNYDARAVAAERCCIGSKRTWDPDLLLGTVRFLIGALADVGNSDTSNFWLQYLSDCGLRSQDAPDIWEHVRSAHPHEVIPTQLSGESPVCVPAWTRPATLNGERPRCTSVPYWSSRVSAFSPVSPRARGIRPWSQCSHRSEGASQRGVILSARLNQTAQKRSIAPNAAESRT